jgi:hypothetical protein
MTPEIRYFVSFTGGTKDEQYTARGNIELTLDGPVTSMEQIREMTRHIEHVEQLKAVVITHWQRFEEEKPKLYSATLKTREQMERDIPRDHLGWWHDVCPGATMKLREATAADIERCYVREGKTRDPADYLCENMERGSLVLRAAVAELTEIHA